MQDTATSAMTELSLGLAMAFFSLLIVALLSMGQASYKPVLDENTIDISATSKHANNDEIEQSQYVFYFREKLYNQTLTEISSDDINTEQPLVLVVDANLSLASVLTVKQQFTHPNLLLNALNDEWRLRLTQLVEGS